MIQLCPFEVPELLNGITLEASKGIDTEVDSILDQLSDLPTEKYHLVKQMLELEEQKTALVQQQTAQKLCSCPSCKATLA